MVPQSIFVVALLGTASAEEPSGPPAVASSVDFFAMTQHSQERNAERRIVEFAKILDGDGPEPLELAVKYAHRHGVELIAWFPFNETH